MFVVLRIANSGYWGGDPEKILKAPVDIVMKTLLYDVEIGKYEAEIYNNENS